MLAQPNVFTPTKLGPVTLRNRIIKAATFEAATPDALVTEDLITYHRLPAAGGVGMTTVAYCAVSPGGQAETGSIWMRPEAVPGLQKLTAAIHEEGAAISAQIGHAGPVAHFRTHRGKALAPVRLFNPLGMKFAKRASRDDIEDVITAHATAARFAIESGFDAVEIHLGHNYFASSFLSPLINRRDDEFGGSLENRAKVARGIVLAVRRAVQKEGNRIAVTAKVSLADGFRGGVTTEEGLDLARLLEADGTLDALQLSGGSSLMNPMYLFRGGAPVKEFAAAMPLPVRWGMRVGGARFLKEYPFEEAYFLDKALRFREALSMPLTLLGGINRRDTMEKAMAQGFDFVAMGRALLREPDLVRKLQDERQVEGLCIHCNRCMPTIYTTTHCPVARESQAGPQP